MTLQLKYILTMITNQEWMLEKKDNFIMWKVLDKSYKDDSYGQQVTISDNKNIEKNFPNWLCNYCWITLF